MDIKQYQEKKNQILEAQKQEQTKQRILCLSCFRPKKACFCDTVTPFSTFFKFCLLMHPKEAKKERLGTGRMTNNVLINSQIIVDENFDQNDEVQEILKSDQYYPMLLYPGNKSLNISNNNIDRDHLKNKIPLIFVLDGTWPCAKTMIRETKTLHSIPRISFSSEVESKFAIKHQPSKYCLSTIESIFQVISILEEQGLENVGEKKFQLMELLSHLVEFQIKCATDPNLSSYRKKKTYKDPSERKPSKKWDSRNICFDGHKKKSKNLI